jgi:hypothetical protein
MAWQCHPEQGKDNGTEIEDLELSVEKLVE